MCQSSLAGEMGACSGRVCVTAEAQTGQFLRFDAGYTLVQGIHLPVALMFSTAISCGSLLFENVGHILGYTAATFGNHQDHVIYGRSQPW